MQITDPEDLLQLCNRNGIIEHSGSLSIHCEIDKTMAQSFKGIEIRGSLSVFHDFVITGPVAVSGEVFNNANFFAANSISVGGPIIGYGSLYTLSNLKVGGRLSLEGSLFVGNDLLLDSRLTVKKDLVTLGNTFWDFPFLPTIGNRWFHQRVLPNSHALKFYENRLGIKILDENEEVSVNMARINQLPSLRLLPSENLIFKSLKYSPSSLPAWVEDIREYVYSKFPTP